LAAALAAVSAVGAALCVRTPYLVVRTPGGRLAASFALSRFDSSFSLGYLHSVARLPCVETFRSTPGGGLELIRTSYKGLGAGLPFTEEGGVLHLENGWIVLEGLSRRFPRITVQPASFTDHHLIVGERKYLLDGLTGGGPAVLSIERRSFLRRLAPDGRIRYIKP